MQTILVVGAGKTSTYLIEYLLANALRRNWKVIVADSNINAIIDKTNNHPCSEPATVDINNPQKRADLVGRADIVVSVLPPSLHILLAKDCLALKKHLITSSYISPEMIQLDTEVASAGLMFMCEMGLDPGIDHMSANKLIHSIQKVAGSIRSLKSYTGGLVAPESDDNPWHYKFTWNPKNVIIAGKAGATYISNGKKVTVDYKDLFAHPKKGIKIDDKVSLEYYPNRDSLSYISKYDLPDIKTFMRATYRQQGYMKAWNILVHLGLTDTSDIVDAETYAEWIRSKNNFTVHAPLEDQIRSIEGVDVDNTSLSKISWLGILDDTAIPNTGVSSANILLDVLSEKWVMTPEDKDMIVMRHEIEYTHKNDNSTELTSTMVIKGEDSKRSAMAKTVGLPMAILTKLILTKKILPPSGVCIPNMQSVYKPVLAELETHGITFVETVS